MPPSLCTRCILRLLGPRTFTTTANLHKSLPQFLPSTQPDLNNLLTQIRTQHLLPAALSPRERNLLYKPKHAQRLLDNPYTATLGGGEEIVLQHTNKVKDVRSLHRDLLPAVVEAMRAGERRDWENLPLLLAGLKKARIEVREAMRAKMLRLALNAGAWGAVLRCLHQAKETGVTLKDPGMRGDVLLAIRSAAQKARWSEEATTRAIRDAGEIARLLESEEHGTGRMVASEGDPRRDPWVLGVYLELAAVYAYKHQGGVDVDGKVRTFAERVLANVDPEESMPPSNPTPEETGPQQPLLQSIPLWHGLSLSLKVLDASMPQRALAEKLVSEWGSAIERLVEGLNERAVKTIKVKRKVEQEGGEVVKVKEERTLRRWPKSGTYAAQARNCWRGCIRD